MDDRKYNDTIKNSSFCFLDESGTLNLNSQPYFTIGMIKCKEPYYLQSNIRSIREKNNFWWEIKFNGLNKTKVAVSLKVLDLLFELEDISFSSYTIDKRCQYFLKEFKSDPFIAYEKMSEHLLKGNIKRSELLVVLADNIVTPKRFQYEISVKKKINEQFDRMAIAGICRLDSRTNDLLQLTDLLIGSIIPSDYKIQFVSQLKNKLGIKSLATNFKSNSFNIHYHASDEEIRKKVISQSS